MRKPARAASVGFTLALTNLIKLGGLIVFIRETLTERDDVVLAGALFMMTGAQLSESFVLRLIDSFLGHSGSDPDQDAESSS